MSELSAELTPELESISGKLSSTGSLSGTLSDVPGKLVGTINDIKNIGAYNGLVEITPTNQTQVLETKQKLVRENIVINPIPQNYGLITWNGSVITVS